MLSEDLIDQDIAQDVLSTMRKKFFEWSDAIATAKIFPNDSREKDIFVIEILSNKLTKD